METQDKEILEDKPEEPGSCGKTGSCNGCSNASASAKGEANDDRSSSDLSEENGCHRDNGHGDDELISRSNFIRTAFCCTALAWGGVALAPIAAYLIPPAGEDESTSKITSVEVCKLSELPKGSGRNFRFGSYPALLIHTLDGNLHAFKAVCTHLGCTVQFRTDKQCIYCACHGGEYNTEGKNVAGPPPKPLPELKVAVVEGTIVVSKA